MTVRQSIGRLVGRLVEITGVVSIKGSHRKNPTNPTTLCFLAIRTIGVLPQKRGLSPCLEAITSPRLDSVYLSPPCSVVVAVFRMTEHEM